MKAPRRSLWTSAPLTAPPTDSRNDLAPGPEQQQSKSAQDVQQPEQTPQEKIEPPPPVPDAEVKLPEEIKPAGEAERGTDAAGPGNDIAAAPKAVRGASRFMASQNCPAGRAAQRLSAFCARAARDRHRTNSHLRSIATERL